jgi:hypothetical protein
MVEEVMASQDALKDLFFLFSKSRTSEKGGRRTK